MGHRKKRMQDMVTQVNNNSNGKGNLLSPAPQHPILLGDNEGDDKGQFTVKNFTAEDLKGQEIGPSTHSEAELAPFLHYINTGEGGEGLGSGVNKAKSVRSAFINNPKNKIPVFKKDDPNNPALNQPKSTLYGSSQ